MKKIYFVISKLILSAVALFISATVCNADDREHQLKVYNWADYIDESLLEEFEVWYKEQTGEDVKIIYQLFDVNEVMLSKIEKGHEDFDVVCPSDYIIERMLRSDLLLPIDQNFGETPNYITNVASYITDMFDKIEGMGKNANDYSVGYMWGTTGILYNTKYVTREEALSWDSLKDEKFKGKLFVKDAFRDVYTSLLIALNKEKIKSGEVDITQLSFDSSDESIALVENYINEFKANVAGWEADFGKEMMTKEKGWLNLSWSGDAQWAIEEAEKVGVSLDYAVPREGSTVWFDGWVIPKYAKNVKAARYFINFLCKPENALRNMEEIGYVSAIGGDEILAEMSDSTAYEAIDASYFFGERATAVHLNPILYPDASTMKRCGMMHDSGEGTEKLLAMWSRIKGDNASWTTYIILAIGVLVLFLAVYGRSKKKRRQKKVR